jgi:hypothetical protein
VPIRRLPAGDARFPLTDASGKPGAGHQLRCAGPGAADGGKQLEMSAEPASAQPASA